MNSEKPIKTLDDLEGLVFRVPKNEIMIATYQSWGSNPTPMAWAELFTALQQKVVDGQDLNVLDLAAGKFYEVQSHLSKIHYNFLLEPMIMAILGVLVGGLVVAMYLPIFKMGSVI